MVVIGGNGSSSYGGSSVPAFSLLFRRSFWKWSRRWLRPTFLVIASSISTRIGKPLSKIFMSTKRKEKKIKEKRRSFNVATNPPSPPPSLPPSLLPPSRSTT
ncbi:hypothetical protein M0804_010152 [Polistes exclamans]|nr:hypothetical protein M0804_010152 [Polistes exclamans]